MESSSEDEVPLTPPSTLILDDDMIAVAKMALTFSTSDIGVLVLELSLELLDEMIRLSEKVSNLPFDLEMAEKVRKMATLVMFQCKELKSAKLQSRRPTRIYCYCVFDLDVLIKYHSGLPM